MKQDSVKLHRVAQISMALVLAIGISVIESSCDGSIASTPAERNTREAAPLVHVSDIPLPGPASRFDYQSYDAAKGLLFIAHLGAGTVVVFDTRAKKVVGDIAEVSKVHGVLVVPEEARVYATATGTNEVVAIDENALKIIARAPGGAYPDGIAYAPDVRKLYVSDQAGRTETVIDTRTNQRIKTIELGGEAGNSQYDAVSRHVFVNVQTRNELVEIDPVTDSIVQRHALPGAQRNHGLLIDSPHRLAFIACEGNHKLVVLDLQSMQVRESYAVGEDPDVLAFDERLGLLYVASESGVLAMFKQEARTLRALGRWSFAPRAHSVAVNPETHEVYFPLESVRGRPMLRIARPSESERSK